MAYTQWMHSYSRILTCDENGAYMHPEAVIIAALIAAA
jgi:hypothetical protein